MIEPFFTVRSRKRRQSESSSNVPFVSNLAENVVLMGVDTGGVYAIPRRYKLQSILDHPGRAHGAGADHRRCNEPGGGWLLINIT
jgi:hypothetical protein